MKNILLFTTLVSVQAGLFGQNVPNGTFENWNSTPYDELNGWQSGNKESIPMMGLACITKVNGYTGFGVRMQTSIIAGDTAYAYIALGDPKGQGGVPYSQIPTAITGYYRYNLPGNDTALLLVTFKKNGNIINEDMFKIRGTGSQSAFAPFSFPLSLSSTPDTVILAAAASNLLDNNGIQNGSFLELDKLIFTGSGITQQVPNNEFENWTPKSFDVPAGWETWGNGTTKTIDKYAGNYAVRLETIDQGWGVWSSGITTGHMTDSTGPAGGLPYTNTNDTLCGYYKYMSAGGSDGSVHVSLTKNGSPVGGNSKSLTAVSVYTYFELPFQAGIIPDTIRIDAESSTSPATQAHIGSVLHLDNLYLKSSTLGIFEQEGVFQSFSFPNPVNNVLSVVFEKNLLGDMKFFIYDETGRKAAVNNVYRNKNSVKADASNLAPGIYFYEIRTAEGTTRNKFIKY